MPEMTFFTPQDLTGCRYRLVQRRAHPDAAPTATTAYRHFRLARARAEVRALLPTKPLLGDGKTFRRLNLEPGDDPELDYLDTLEALATGATLIVNPTLLSGHFALFLDALVAQEDGTYMPVVVSNHRVARPHATKTLKVISTARLGLGRPVTARYKLKHHSVDSYTALLANDALEELGMNSHRAIVIGQDRSLGFVLNTDLFRQGLETALAQPIPTQAHRVKECATCRYWPTCEEELQARDDISLLYAGDAALRFRQRGITTITQLATSEQEAGTEPQQLARAYRAGVVLLRRPGPIVMPRFDVEIDIDVEAYLDQGAYLWGGYDGHQYRGFATWAPLGGVEEARNFAAAWQWLQHTRDQAMRQGRSWGVFCYSAHGENHWLRSSAERFSGRFAAEVPGLPTPEDIAEFIASDQWVDVFAVVRQHLYGPAGLGLKVVAPAAGFAWEESEVDGEKSVHLYLEATTGNEKQRSAARRRLLSYNGDDCRATAAVREFLSQGAPSVQATPVEWCGQ